MPFLATSQTVLKALVKMVSCCGSKSSARLDDCVHVNVAACVLSILLAISLTC